MIAIKRVALIIVFLIIVSGTIYYFHYGFPWNMSKHKDLFEAYLEDTYQKDFIISEISFDMIHNTYHANAYEKDNTDLSFYVGEDNSNKEINDGYEFEIAVVEARKDVEKILNEGLSDYIRFGVELINYSNKELEINIRTGQEVDDVTKQRIQSKIEEKGYVANQIYYYKE